MWLEKYYLYRESLRELLKYLSVFRGKDVKNGAGKHFLLKPWVWRMAVADFTSLQMSSFALIIHLDC